MDVAYVAYMIGWRLGYCTQIEFRADLRAGRQKLQHYCLVVCLCFSFRSLVSNSKQLGCLTPHSVSKDGEDGIAAHISLYPFVHPNRLRDGGYIRYEDTGRSQIEVLGIRFPSEYHGKPRQPDPRTRKKLAVGDDYSEKTSLVLEYDSYNRCDERF
ncbi:hypothetical protein BV22DRAFT_181826 [Leucogyrophana mollusca]|uniref:Uncharacterized protein n=1 Tax=Leucogyrophana mollusca TaxID=85980 RepID=A0ACB8BUE6_9AGAM|nr:hypothetical protein BV22DRAFT_181826 [Leucogyrophana mollusca]